MLEGGIALLRVYIRHTGCRLAMLYAGWHRACLSREKSTVPFLTWCSYLVFLQPVISFALDTEGGNPPASEDSFWWDAR
jgi:hypothetical protein